MYSGELGSPISGQLSVGRIGGTRLLGNFEIGGSKFAMRLYQGQIHPLMKREFFLNDEIIKKETQINNGKI